MVKATIVALRNHIIIVLGFSITCARCRDALGTLILSQFPKRR